MRRCAKRITRRRISWTDQRTRGRASAAGAAAFWGCRVVGMVADGRQHGKGQHDQAHVAVPAIARADRRRQGRRSRPRQERVSLWSRPSSVFAVSNASSMARRLPSTATKVSMPVPAGHHVLKQASAPSARLRRISRPRVQMPSRVGLNASASRSASSRQARSQSRAPMAPSPADRRCQVASSSPWAISAAVPQTRGLLIYELKDRLAAVPST